MLTAPHADSRKRLWKGGLWVACAVFMGAAAAGGLPLLARYVPWRAEQALFAVGNFYRPSQYCQTEETPAGAAFAKIVKRIYPLDEEDRSLPLKVHVLRGGMVNAFAAPGGHIFVLESLLHWNQSPEELAGILAHEIEHVKQRHVTAKMLQHLLLLFVWGPLFSSAEAICG